MSHTDAHGPHNRITAKEMSPEETRAIEKHIRMRDREQRLSNLAEAMIQQVQGLTNSASADVMQTIHNRITTLRIEIAADWVRQLQKPDIPLAMKIDHLKKQSDYFTDALVEMLQRSKFFENSGSKSIQNISKMMNRIFTEALQMLQKQNEALVQNNPEVQNRLTGIQTENRELTQEIIAMNQGGTKLGVANSQLGRTTNI